jgi:hypothetical protein
MTDYTARTALIDLGFIGGYLHETDTLPANWGMFEAMLDAIQRITEYATQGHLNERPANPASYALFLHDLGFLRGLIWSHPISSAVSEAIRRVIVFVTENEQFPCQLLDGCGHTAEVPVHRLSDEQRHAIDDAADSGEDSCTSDFAEAVGATYIGVLEHWRKMGALTHEEVEEEIKKASKPAAELPSLEAIAIRGIADREQSLNPFNPNGKRGRRAWTPEQRAAQAERARKTQLSKPPLVPDSEFPNVKADFEAGLSFDAIGSKHHCSGSHIRNFLQKHGVDPRRSHPGVRHGGRPEFTESEVQTIIDEKAKGTPSEEIGDMIGRNQHVVDVKYSEMKKEGMVPEEHLTPEALAEKKQHQNDLVSEKMTEYHAGKRAGREPRLGEELIEPIKQFVAEGLSDVDIGKEYDVGSQTVADFRRRHGIKKRQGWNYQLNGAPPEEREDSSPERLISAHNSYAGKRDPQPNPLQESDWPDIEQMLNKQRRSVSQIASDYEVDFDTMRAFIDEHSPGEPRPHGLTGTAA